MSSSERTGTFGIKGSSIFFRANEIKFWDKVFSPLPHTTLVEVQEYGDRFEIWDDVLTLC
ncbi:hypothetical protein [Maribacter sp. IgM3_T14_3]|uniref:hypothetical protein n=1 Tax=Maribacter sp. IgM3_T14_3 TaxID=3415140 RepID=UPI003C6F4BAA